MSNRAPSVQEVHRLREEIDAAHARGERPPLRFVDATTLFGKPYNWMADATGRLHLIGRLSSK